MLDQASKNSKLKSFTIGDDEEWENEYLMQPLTTVDNQFTQFTFERLLEGFDIGEIGQSNKYYLTFEEPMSYNVLKEIDTVLKKND